MSSMFKFPISSEAEPRWREWLVCPDCQVWCHNSTGLGREGAGRHHPCLHLHPPGASLHPSLHPSPHCTPALVQRGLHRDTEARAARPLLAGSALQWWRGGQVCAHCVVPVVHRSPPPADTDTGAAELVLPLLCSAVT